MITCILSLGSNEEREKNIRYMRTRLAEIFPDIVFSKAVYTDPVDCVSEKKFLNQTAIFRTGLNAEQIRNHLKNIEEACGRTATEKQKGIIRADIDLVQYGRIILKPKDINRPDVRTGISELKKLFAGYFPEEPETSVHQ